MSNRIDKPTRNGLNWRRLYMNRALYLFPFVSIQAAPGTQGLSVQAAPGTSGLVVAATSNTLVVTVVVILVVGITGAVVVWASRS